MSEFGVFPIFLENDLLKVDKILEKGWLFLLRFSQTWLFWSSIANWPRGLRFSLPSIILTDLSFRKQNFTLTGSKGHGFWFVIGRFPSVLCVSVFQGSLLMIVIMIDGSQKRNCEGGVWTGRVRMFLKSTVRQEKTSQGLKTAFFFVLLLGESTENNKALLFFSDKATIQSRYSFHLSHYAVVCEMINFRVIWSVNEIVLFNGFLSDFVEITSCAYTNTTILFNLGE